MIKSNKYKIASTTRRAAAAQQEISRFAHDLARRYHRPTRLPVQAFWQNYLLQKLLKYAEICASRRQPPRFIFKGAGGWVQQVLRRHLQLNLTLSAHFFSSRFASPPHVSFAAFAPMIAATNLAVDRSVRNLLQMILHSRRDSALPASSWLARYAPLQHIMQQEMLRVLAATHITNFGNAEMAGRGRAGKNFVATGLANFTQCAFEEDLIFSASPSASGRLTETQFFKTLRQVTQNFIQTAANFGSLLSRQSDNFQQIFRYATPKFYGQKKAEQSERMNSTLIKMLSAVHLRENFSAALPQEGQWRRDRFSSHSFFAATDFARAPILRQTNFLAALMRRQVSLGFLPGDSTVEIIHNAKRFKPLAFRLLERCVEEIAEMSVESWSTLALASNQRAARKSYAVFQPLVDPILRHIRFAQNKVAAISSLQPGRRREEAVSYPPQSAYALSPAPYVFAAAAPSAPMQETVKTLVEAQVQKSFSAPSEAWRGTADHGKNGEPQIDYERLSDKVYSSFLRKIRNERERVG